MKTKEEIQKETVEEIKKTVKETVKELNEEQEDYTISIEIEDVKEEIYN